MVRYVVVRLLVAVPVVLIVASLVFVLGRVMPGDPVAVMLGDQGAPEDIARLRQTLGLDDPLPLQYVRWLGQALLRLDLGDSIYLKRPVVQALAERIAPTFMLTALGAGLAILGGVSLGVTSALHRNTWVDRVVMVLALLGLSIPSFWLGLALILVFAVWLHVLPSSGYDGARYLLLPAVAIGLSGMGIIARMARSSLLDVLRQSYVQTARSKGLTNRTVIWRHAMRNALVPTLTVVGLIVTSLAGGAIVVESVFAIPGAGRLIIQSVARRDYPVIQGGVMFVALLYVLANLIVDVLYAYIDPRVRYS